MAEVEYKNMRSLWNLAVIQITVRARQEGRSAAQANAA